MSCYDVDIVDETTLQVRDHCEGPTPAGSCPRAEAGVVACAGHRIAPRDAGAEYWMLWVPPGSRHCPLAWPIAEACC